MDDSAVRVHIYEAIVRTGAVPLVAEIARALGVAPADVSLSLRRLHDAHMLVLQPSGEILMANPFSAVPTPFITGAAGRRWFGNCIWDSLGILATLHSDGDVLTSCGCCGDAMTLRVEQRKLQGDGIVHFALPARRWWDDIVFN